MGTNLLGPVKQGSSDHCNKLMDESSENEDRRNCRIFRQFLRKSVTYWPTVGPKVRRVFVKTIEYQVEKAKCYLTGCILDNKWYQRYKRFSILCATRLYY